MAKRDRATADRVQDGPITAVLRPTSGSPALAATDHPVARVEADRWTRILRVVRGRLHKGLLRTRSRGDSYRRGSIVVDGLCGGGSAPTFSGTCRPRLGRCVRQLREEQRPLGLRSTCDVGVGQRLARGGGFLDDLAEEAGLSGDGRRAGIGATAAVDRQRGDPRAGRSLFGCHDVPRCARLERTQRRANQPARGDTRPDNFRQPYRLWRSTMCVCISAQE